MAKAEWGADPEFFGPRHAHREGRIVRRLEACVPAAGPHLECAAGVGSLSVAIARRGRTVIAADSSLRSLAVISGRSAAQRRRILPVVADITALPFATSSMGSATTAETLEHVPDHQAASRELARVLAPGACLVGTVPADPGQWSDWDEWAGHLRRYTPETMRELLRSAGLEAQVTVWGWPLLRLYDQLFLQRVNRRRLRTAGPAEADPQLRRVAELGRKRMLVTMVRGIFELDRLFDGARGGVGLLFSARKG